jgi:hypothetical protein
MFTISFSNGASDESFETQEQAEAHLDQVLTEGYELEYFEDRALFWASEEESKNDDGANALGSIRWEGGDR